VIFRHGHLSYFWDVNALEQHAYWFAFYLKIANVVLADVIEKFVIQGLAYCHTFVGIEFEGMHKEVLNFGGYDFE